MNIPTSLAFFQRAPCPISSKRVRIRCPVHTNTRTIVGSPWLQYMLPCHRRRQRQDISLARLVAHCSENVDGTAAGLGLANSLQVMRRVVDSPPLSRAAASKLFCAMRHSAHRLVSFSKSPMKQLVSLKKGVCLNRYSTTLLFDESAACLVALRRDDLRASTMILKVLGVIAVRIRVARFICKVCWRTDQCTCAASLTAKATHGRPARASDNATSVPSHPVLTE